MQRKFFRGFGMILFLMALIMAFSEPKTPHLVIESGFYFMTLASGLFGLWLFYVNTWAARKSLLRNYHR